MIPQIAEKAVRDTLSNEKLVQLMREKKKFDAVIVEIFMTDALFGMILTFFYFKI